MNRLKIDSTLFSLNGLIKMNLLTTYQRPQLLLNDVLRDK